MVEFNSRRHLTFIILCLGIMLLLIAFSGDSVSARGRVVVNDADARSGLALPSLSDVRTVQNELNSERTQLNHMAHFAAMGISAFIIILCVIVHYEALRYWSLYARKIPTKPRIRILLGIFYITLLHFIEIWFFAFGYAYMDSVPVLGELAGAANDGMLEYAYFSAVCYSTLGFGDIIPQGPLRLLSAAEALLGLIMITWSASYTYLQMQRDWHPGDK